MPVFTPQIGAKIDLPAPILDSARFLRVHRAAAKDAMRTTLKLHQLKRLESHFKQTNRAKYNHAPRTARYKAQKRRKYHSITDLVKTGETRRRMLNEHHAIRIGGTADTELKASMVMHFPFPEGDRNPYGGIDVAQMRKEITSWTDDEIREAAGEFQEYYFDEIEAALERAPRWKKQIGAQVTAARAAL